MPTGLRPWRGEWAYKHMGDAEEAVGGVLEWQVKMKRQSYRIILALSSFGNNITSLAECCPRRQGRGTLVPLQLYIIPLLLNAQLAFGGMRC